jgi:hypothetical protein
MMICKKQLLLSANEITSITDSSLPRSALIDYLTAVYRASFVAADGGVRLLCGAVGDRIGQGLVRRVRWLERQRQRQGLERGYRRLER